MRAVRREEVVGNDHTMHVGVRELRADGIGYFGIACVLVLEYEGT